MQRCASCNGTLLREETKCFLCGTEVPPLKTAVPFHERFRKVIKACFIFSACLTVLSLFFSFTPSFSKCLVATLTLLLVKSSADQMSASQ